MRATAFLLTGLLLLAAFAALAPTASAVAYCAKAGGIEKNNWSEPCRGVVCLGYTNGRWTNCVARPLPSPCELIECYCTCPPVQSEVGLERLLGSVVA